MLPSDWLAYLPDSAAAGLIADSFAKLFSRFHWVSILSALVLATLVWASQRRKLPPGARTGLAAFLFPRRIWLHRSALLDYRFVLIDKVLLASAIGVIALVIVPGGNEAVFALGDDLVDEVAKEIGEDFSASPWLLLGYTVSLLVAEDFLRYWAHRLMHSSSLLWQFHKVHHSSEVLVPLSQLRTHPVNGLVNLIRSGLAIGIVTTIFLLVYPSQLNALTIIGINAGRFVFDAAGSHLRHSHVWLGFGPVLSRFVISPAMHQIHHSRLRHHWDKNFGSQFALWDWLFGTLHIPARRERVAFGIAGESGRMRSVRDLYLQPFRDARRLFSRD